MGKLESEDDMSEEDHQGSALVHPENEPQGDVSSVASSMYSQMRSYFTLRNSIEEKFVPVSIGNLRNAAALVFVTLLVLNIAQFILQRQLFGQVNSNIVNIHNSEMRISYIIDINLRVQNLRFYNEGLLTDDFFYLVNSSEFQSLENQLLLQSATALQTSQTSLSLATATLDQATREQIDPPNVPLVYENEPGPTPEDPVGPASLPFNIWECVIKIVVYCYELTSDPTNVVTSNPVVSFVQNNCLNSLLSALKQSTNAIVVATNNIRDSALSFFLSLLIAVSCALAISVAFLLPIISRVIRSKQEVLELFLHKKIERSIDEQLKLCRWFISKYQ